MISSDAVELLVASSNLHKIREIREVLGPLGFRVIGLDGLAMRDIPEPVEDGDTFEQNARIKAVGYARATGRMCLADDSGLAVDALNGDPGVHSARYAGISDSREDRDQRNNEKLLHAVEDVADDHRTARFICAMCLCDSGGTILTETRGEFEGVIAREPRGDNGFGYDPLLFLPDRNCTSAELSPDEKNARSHRGQATRAIAEFLRSRSLANS